MIFQLTLLCGALVGLGVWLVVRGLLWAPSDLSAALQRLEATPLTDRDARTAAPTAKDRFGVTVEKVTGSFPFVTVPHRDLALLDRSVADFYAEKGMAAFLGLLFAPLLTSVLPILAGFPISIPLSVGSMLLLAAVLFMVPDVDVRNRASAARARFRRALASYVDFVALEKIGGAGTIQAMTSAASVADSWIFRRIQQTIERANLRGSHPWTDLKSLGDELGIKDLGEIADIIRLSGEEGAAIWENLRARSRSMRSQQVRSDQSRSNATSEILSAPIALLAVSFMGLLITPALLTITSS